MNAGNLIGVEAKIEKAEHIWMNKGLYFVLNTVKMNLKISDEDFNKFQIIYSEKISNDKIDFFRLSTSANDFLDETKSENYIKWLSIKEDFYKSTAKNFLSDKDSIVKKYEFINSMSFVTTCSTNVNCTNVGFESNNFSTWEAYLGNACQDPNFGIAGCHAFTPTTSTTTGRVTIQSGSGYDAIVGSSVLPVVCPGGSYSLLLENQVNGGNATKITRKLNVTGANSVYLYKYALVLEDPGKSHKDDEKPFFRVSVTVLDDATCNTIDTIKCAEYLVFANPENNEVKSSFLRVSPSSPYYYKNWTSVAIPLNNYIGKTIKIEFIVSDCAWGGHLGYAYLDGDCLNSAPTISACVGSERTITAPEGFTSYWWSGYDIHGTNTSKIVKTGAAGAYQLIASTITNCELKYEFSVDSCPFVSPANCSISNVTATPTSCNSANNYYDLNGTITFTSCPSSGVLIITNGYLSQMYTLPLASPFNYTFKNLMADGVAHPVKAVFYKSYFISPTFISCQLSNTYTAPAPCGSATISCPNCLTSFNPEPGKYIVSAWVKDLNALSDVETYLNPYIEIKFSSGTSTTGQILASGKIIEKWQRVFFEFTIPIGATDISIYLGTNSGACLFDDIRIHPANGSFVSYVYDPVSLKLVATLDDNNYATIYEYDDEGTLLRVKKETERGIMTIKESRENSPKR